MGNAASTQNGALLTVSGSPNDIRNKKRLSFQGIFKPTKSTSYDADITNIIDSRPIEISPGKDGPAYSDQSPHQLSEDVLSLVSVPFSQGKRKPQVVKASDPKMLGNDAESDSDHEQTSSIDVMPELQYAPTPPPKLSDDRDSEPGAFAEVKKSLSMSLKAIANKVAEIIVESMDTKSRSDSDTSQGVVPQEHQQDMLRSKDAATADSNDADSDARNSLEPESKGFTRATNSAPVINVEAIRTQPESDAPEDSSGNMKFAILLDAIPGRSSKPDSTGVSDGKKIVNPAIEALKKNKQESRVSTGSIESNKSRRSRRKQFSRGSSKSQSSSIESLRSIIGNQANATVPNKNESSIQSKDSSIFNSNLVLDSAAPLSVPPSSAHSVASSVNSFSRARAQSSTGSYSSVHLRNSMKPMPSEQHSMRRNTVKRAAAIAKFRMIKFNSTSTLYVDTTMVNADLQESLRYISIYLANIIRHNVSMGLHRTVDILSEKMHLLSRHIQFYHREPTEEEIFRFFECLFQSAELNVECVIITLIYIQRMLKNTGLTLQPINWARTVLGGVILASKVWDDHAVWNVDFCQIFPDVDVTDFNNLERFFMASIYYDVSVRASTYARYYFELRDLADTPSRPWALRPLRRNETKKLLPKEPPPPPPQPQQNSGEDSHSDDAHDAQTESQTQINVKTKRTDRKLSRSHSDYQFVPPNAPAFVN